jgi:ankyrin repeat protein
VLLSKDRLDKTACHMAANNGHVEVIEKLLDLAELQQLTPEDLRNVFFLKRPV